MRLDSLPEKHRRVCDLLVRNHSEAAIATALGLSAADVARLRALSFDTLGITNAMELLAVYVSDAVQRVRAKLPPAVADDGLEPLAFLEEVLP